LRSGGLITIRLLFTHPI